MFLNALLINLFGNFIFWFLLGFIVWLFYLIPVRKCFESFFGLKHVKTIDIYLSNLWDTNQAATIEWGDVIAGVELEGAKTVSNLFASASPGFPEIVRGLVDNIWIQDKFNVNLKTSPKEFDPPFPMNSFIVIGATTKNSVRRYFLKRDKLLVKIKNEPINHPSDIHKNPLEQVFIIKRDQGPAEYKVSDGCRPALIERVVIGESDDSENRVAFMCVGIKGEDSMRAADYLAHNWHELSREACSHNNFTRCLSLNSKGIVAHYFDVK